MHSTVIIRIDANQGTIVNWAMCTRIRTITDLKTTSPQSRKISVNNFLNKKQQLRRHFGFCDAREISTAKCKSGFVYKVTITLILTLNSRRKKDIKFSQLKVSFKYLLV